MEENNLNKLKELQKKLAERDEELRMAKETLELIIENSTDGFWDWYINEDYEYISPKFKKQLGYTNKEMENHPSAWKKYIFKEDMEKLGNELDKHFATKGIHPMECTCRYNHKNGSIVHIWCRGKVIEWNEDGSPKRMIGTHVDVTKIIKDGK